MRRSIAEVEAAYNAAVDRLETLNKRDDESEEFGAEFGEAVEACDRLKQELEDARAFARSRAKHRFVPLAEGGTARMSVSEPDLYERGGRSFLHDLFSAQIRGDLVAQDRLQRHQAYEVEKRAMTSSTFGGLIPPAYLLDLYAKASRKGRKFADACDQQELPPAGMSLILPRLTTGTAGAVQTAENQTVATQDAAETDLTVPVRTIAGYVPVSRQGIERAQYNDAILFEDLVARNYAALDVQCINGSGASGQMLGMNQTSGIETVALNSWSVGNLWGALADAIQRIATNVGGLGLEADRIAMHPRRWAAIASSLDANDRPLLLPTGAPAFNALGEGSIGRYGIVGELMGVEVITDANIPTTEGVGSDEDLIFVFASPVVHVWERPEDPVTLTFEQVAGTELQLTLIVYSYAAFSAGRYPDASAVITGAGLTPPTYGERAS